MVDSKDIEQLYHKMEQIESLLRELKSSVVQKHAITIEKLDVHGPLIEYHFDEVDVDEVSGSLNLGINFGIPNEENASIGKTTKYPSVDKDKNVKQESPQTHQPDLNKLNQQVEERLQEVLPKIMWKGESSDKQINTKQKDREMKELSSQRGKYRIDANEPSRNGDSAHCKDGQSVDSKRNQESKVKIHYLKKVADGHWVLPPDS